MKNSVFVKSFLACSFFLGIGLSETVFAAMELEFKPKKVEVMENNQMLLTGSCRFIDADAEAKQMSYSRIKVVFDGGGEADVQLNDFTSDCVFISDQSLVSNDGRVNLSAKVSYDLWVRGDSCHHKDIPLSVKVDLREFASCKNLLAAKKEAAQQNMQQSTTQLQSFNANDEESGGSVEVDKAIKAIQCICKKKQGLKEKLKQLKVDNQQLSELNFNLQSSEKVLEDKARELQDSNIQLENRLAELDLVARQDDKQAALDLAMQEIATLTAKVAELKKKLGKYE